VAERDVMGPGEFGHALHRFLNVSLELAPHEEPEVARRLREHLGVDALDDLPILRRELDRSDHPNLQLALDKLTDWSVEMVGLRSERMIYGHDSVGSLAQLAASARPEHAHGPAMAALEHVTVPIGGGRSISCVVNALLLLRSGERVLAALIGTGESRMGAPRLRLEVIGRERAEAEALLAEIDALMLEHDVYRGRVVAFGGERHMGFSIEVRTLPAVEREAIVLPQGALERIERHALGPARHRERLLAAGRHLKRGLLLHGPPGTGKTLTAMYLIGRMPGRTTVLLTGGSLGLIGPACALARRLQPATVVLEDVDLVAHQRDYDMGGEPLLFQLLNEMDGLAEDADVLFLLTTNRPDVLEPALAARPGRIDQTVELPLPSPEDRRRLIELYARGLTLRVEDLDAVVERLEGASAAHVKELLRKAALQAAEEGEGAGALVVEDRHLAAALEELVISSAEVRDSLFGPPPGPAAFPFPVGRGEGHAEVYMEVDEDY
jgi:ATPase family associated with various cellular activities (AAA)